MSLRGWIIVVLAAIVSALLEACFLPFLPAPWRDIRPILELAVLFVVLSSPRGALVFAGIAGILVDLFRVDAGTFAFGRYITVVVVMILLSQTVLTNRSVYATGALVIAARLVDRLWLSLVHFFGTSLFRLDIRVEPLLSFGTTILWDIGLMTAAFILLALFTRRFLVTITRHSRYYG
ncbi:MAG: hypothetical protein ABIO72_01200 [Patescibacteria group bacterium]